MSNPVSDYNCRLMDLNLTSDHIQDLRPFTNPIHNDAYQAYCRQIIRDPNDVDSALFAAFDAILLSKSSMLERTVGILLDAMNRIRPYLVWTIGNESPGHHPTMPSAVAEFLHTLKNSVFLWSSVVRHKKRGSLYTVLNTATLQVAEGTDLKDMDTLCVYQSMEDGTWWVRKKEEFDDGRFEYVSRLHA